MGIALQNIDYGTQVKAYKAEGTITAGQILKAGTGVMSCLAAGAAPTEGLIGVALISGVTGDHIDVAGDDAIVPVTTGAAVTKDKPVTSDAAGKAIDAAPGAGATLQAVGVAMQAAAGADVKIGVRISIQRITHGGT